ncbi:MAG: HAD family hydrolase [Actinomycetes bacterium]
MTDTAIVDVDGTLVDTNYLHVLAWSRAFARHGLTPEMWRIHHYCGMGGDQLVPAVVGEEVDEKVGDAVRAGWEEEFGKLQPEVRPFDRATELLADLKRRGFLVVLASSSKSAQVDLFLDLLNGREHCDAWTTSKDVDETKPNPDLLQVALDKVGGSSGVVIGDSIWDFVAAARTELPGIGLRTGGFTAAELTDAGAAQVFDSPADLLENLDETALSQPA